MASIPIKKLRAWFLLARRDLPWRKDRSIYRVLVSEVMLQQTRVSVVIPYYLRWMERFPFPESLLSISDATLIKFWEGLGYYVRVKRLRLAVLALSSRSKWNEKSLAQLPGVGPYTAAAVACFALRQKGSIPLDGNVARLLVRFWGLFEEIKSSRSRKLLQSLLGNHLLTSRIKLEDLESLIELGSLVCKPKSPSCKICPLKINCIAYQKGLVQQLPIPSPKRDSEVLRRIAFVLYEKDFFWICRSEMVKGLWEFPSFSYSEEEKINLNLDVMGIAHFVARCSPITYHITHFKIRLIGIILTDRQGIDIHSDWESVSLDEISNRAFSSGHRRLLAKALNILIKG